MWSCSSFLHRFTQKRQSHSKTNLYFSINGKTCEDVFYKPFYSFGRHRQLCMQSLQLFADLQKQKPCTKFSLGLHHFLMHQWSFVFNIYYKKKKKTPTCTCYIWHAHTHTRTKAFTESSSDLARLSQDFSKSWLKLISMATSNRWSVREISEDQNKVIIITVSLVAQIK